MLHFIVAPYRLGNRGREVGAGPLQIMEALAVGGVPGAVTEIDVGEISSFMEVNRAIAAGVRQARASQSLPVVLAGNCNSCLGTLAALTDVHPGIVWFDAHGDFHTTETTISGSLEGMSLALATEQLVPEQDVVLVGARDLDPGEDERVRQRLLHIPDANMANHALPPITDTYVHIDMDVLDPSVSPGVNFQGPGGLSVAQLLAALAFTFERFKVAALAITNYHPAKDLSDRTRDIAVEIVLEVERLRRNAASR